ncbi:hypothetical protein [uncultured Gilliamella sp.]|uniref:hypothetical protein n=1 Tax=uncultured Gilliamella sp. TaxID=1193505 RepID=UPI0025F94B71|nr:hypothetical protein [uncultured Gilliamella sp.]
MVNEQVNEHVIEWLPQNAWYVECKTKQDVDLVLHVCREAGISSVERENIIKILRCPIEIGFSSKCFKSIEYAYNKASEILGLKNISDWFFSAIKGKNNV